MTIRAMSPNIATAAIMEATLKKDPVSFLSMLSCSFIVNLPLSLVIALFNMF